MNKCLGFILVVTLFGCLKSNDEKSVDLPDSISDLENVEIFSLNSKTPYSVKLIEESIYGTNGEVFIEGYIRQIAIDKSGRVYLATVGSDNVHIYLFEADGSFVKKLNLSGRGAGEFEDISSMRIWGDKLFVYGSGLQKFAVFSTENFELINEQIVSNELLTKLNQLEQSLRGFEMLVTNQGKKFIKLGSLSLQKEFELPIVFYHEVSEDGFILPGRILELRDFQLYYPNHGGMPFQMPFTRSKRVAMSGDGIFYTVWTDQFLIRKFDDEGNYVEAYYYPFINASLDLDDLELNRSQLRTLGNYDIPDNWQAIRTIEVDDENRLWVSTITDSDQYFNWWVLDDSGEVLADFKMKGNRSSISAMSKPLIKIKNDYFYKLERDLTDGVERIVKYRINFLETR